MRIPVALAALVALSACGTESVGDPAAATPPAVPLVTTTYAVMVLDDGDGAELCLGGVMESLPPQCGGPRLLGWVWADHEGEFERRAGTRWGDFVVTGTFDGTDLTPTEVVAAADAPERPTSDEPDQFATPCPTPADGWPTHPGGTLRTVDRAFATARRLEGYAGAWLDSSRDGRTPEQTDQDFADGREDVSGWTVNVRVAGDPAAAVAELRAVWQGALCVTPAERTERELRAIQRQLSDLPGLLSADVGHGQVTVGVVHDDGSLQRRLDEEHGAGVVEVWSALHAVE